MLPFESIPSPVISYIERVGNPDEVLPVQTAVYRRPPPLTLPEELVDSSDARFEARLQEVHFRHSLIDWLEWYIDGLRALSIDGDYAAASILLFTASEVLCDGVLLYLLWEEGISEADAVAEFKSHWTLPNRMSTCLAERLGGRWERKGTGPVAEWSRDAANLRNRVVHGGYRPTYDEVELARKSIVALQHFIFDRLAVKSDQYKRSSITLLGEDGLRRRNAWTRKLEQFAADDAPVESNWATEFRDWRNQVVQLRDDSSS